MRGNITPVALVIESGGGGQSRKHLSNWNAGVASSPDDLWRRSDVTRSGAEHRLDAEGGDRTTAANARTTGRRGG